MTKGTRLIDKSSEENRPAAAIRAAAARKVPSQLPATISATSVNAPAVHSTCSVPTAPSPNHVGRK